MHCPICGYTTVKARLDVYWCEKCERSWLIHQLKYESFEEASLVAVPPNRRIEE